MRLSKLVVVAVIASTPLAAQQRGALVSGTVLDESGRRLETALVALDARTDRRITRTDSTGRFYFDGVKAGSHELATTSVRLATDVRTVEVKSFGLEVEIVLRQSRALFDTARFVAERTGVLGRVVTRDSLTPLAGAEVQIPVAGVRARTDPEGQFDFANVKPGAWLMFVSRDGFQSRMISVVIPRRGAVTLDLGLDRSTSEYQKFFARPLGSFGQRLPWMNEKNSALISRHELAAHSSPTLTEALRYSTSVLQKGLVLDDSSCVYIDGVFQPAMAGREVNVDGVEAVEVYGSGSDAVRRFGLSGSATCGWPTPLGESGRRMGEVAGTGYRRRNASALPQQNPARVKAIMVWLTPP